MSRAEVQSLYNVSSVLGKIQSGSLSCQKVFVLPIGLIYRITHCLHVSDCSVRADLAVLGREGPLASLLSLGDLFHETVIVLIWQLKSRATSV